MERLIYKNITGIQTHSYLGEELVFSLDSSNDSYNSSGDSLELSMLFYSSIYRFNSTLFSNVTILKLTF